MFSSHEKYVYENLIKVVGSEMDIRIRQNVFLIKDKVSSKRNAYIQQVSSGSLAEGLDLTGSDMDVMIILNNFRVIQNVQHMNFPSPCTTLLMEYDMQCPGFTRLKVIAWGDLERKYPSHECFDKTKYGYFLSNISFIGKIIQGNAHYRSSVHGPCLTDKYKAVDVAYCLHMHFWPRQAEQWIYRHRPGQWPPDILIDEIVKYGCMLVAIGPREVEHNELLWRISFSMAERQLSHAMNYTQILCYALLKLSLKNIIDKYDKCKGLLCSYFMKTTVLWLSEDISINTFQLQNVFHCYLLCLDKLITWVKCCYCPNYFIPEHNMFHEKINRSNSPQLVKVLERLRNGERTYLSVNKLFNSEALLQKSCITLELFCCRVKHIFIKNDLKNAYAQLVFIKSLATSQSSSILSGLCKYYYDMTSQNISQMFWFLTTNKRDVHVVQLYHKHLQDSTKSGDVTGWLFYASCYYELGQYNTTLKIIDHVLSRPTPPGCVSYVQQSKLIPHELKPEVQDGDFNVTPVAMSFCLRFLCYHHLDDIVNRQQSLRTLYLQIKQQTVLRYMLSNELTILGVCNELAGDRKTAYCCYYTALHDKYSICCTAAKRIASLAIPLSNLEVLMLEARLFKKGLKCDEESTIQWSKEKKE